MNSTDGRRVELLRWKHQCGGLELVWNRNWWVSFWIQHTERWTKCKFQVDWPSSAIGRIGVHSFVEDAESQKYWTDHENYPYFWICTLSYVVKSGKQLFSEPNKLCSDLMNLNFYITPENLDNNITCICPNDCKTARIITKNCFASTLMDIT